MAEVEAVTKMRDLIKWLLPQISKLPRSHKFTTAIGTTPITGTTTTGFGALKTSAWQVK